MRDFPEVQAVSMKLKDNCRFPDEKNFPVIIMFNRLKIAREKGGIGIISEEEKKRNGRFKLTIYIRNNGSNL